MSQYTTIETPGGTIWVEVDDRISGNSLVPAGAGNRALESFEEALNALRANAKEALDAVTNPKFGLAPNEVEISFGITAGAEGGNTFFGLAKVSGEASYTVTLKWKYDGEGEDVAIHKKKPDENTDTETNMSEKQDS